MEDMAVLKGDGAAAGDWAMQVIGRITDDAARPDVPVSPSPCSSSA